MDLEVHHQAVPVIQQEITSKVGDGASFRI